MGRGGGGGGRSSRGGGGGASANQTALGAPVADTFRDGENGLNQIGSLFSNYVEDISTNARPDAQMVAAFNRGEINQVPAFVVADGRGGFRPVDSSSASIVASAAAAGLQRLNTVEVRSSDTSLINTTMAANGRPQFGRVARNTSSLSENGRMALSYASDISLGSSRVTASQSQIDAAARAVRSGGGRSIVPIPVRRTGEDRYEIAGGNANQLAVANRAGVRPWIYVVEGG